jgi:hypothetical protein
MPIARTLLQQMAESSYSPKGKPQIGSFTLIFATPTLKFYKDGALIVVSIRGTQVNDPTDLKADAYALVGKLGESERYRRDLDTLKSVQSRLPPPQYRYIGVGHSLGGAILDRFLRAGLILNGISYNPLPEPQELGGNPLHLRVYHKDDPIYKVVGRFIPNVEVRTTKQPIWKYFLPFGMKELFSAYESHGLDSFRGGKKLTFPQLLEQMGLNPKSYLAEIKRKAKEYGYSPKNVSFALDGTHKLEMETPQGQTVKFGRMPYKDFLMWSHLEKNNEASSGMAQKKRVGYWKSHSAMKGDWKDNDYSANWLSMRLLW